MPGNTIENKTFVSFGLRHMICTLLFILAAGCSGDAPQSTATDNLPSNSSSTGSVAFSVQWETDDTAGSKTTHGLIKNAIEDCAAIGIESVTCEVYNESGISIAKGGPWPCNARRGNMERIPAGTNLTFTIMGWDSADGNIIYRGNTTADVMIRPGETTEAGTITATPFVPTGLKASAASTSRIDLTWNDQGASSYRVYLDNKIVANPMPPAFGITDLAAGTQYCFTVSALDTFGNESGMSEPVCTNTKAPPDNEAPKAPTNPLATGVSATQVDITWTAATDNVGAVRYRVYQSGQSVGEVTTTSFSHGDLQPNTQYCYTVEAYDAANNVSPHSAEACARTREIFVWYRDEDRDTFGNPQISIQAEDAPAGYVRNNSDCNDRLASVNPAAKEMCNDIDDNCNNVIDDDCTINPTASFTTYINTNQEIPELFGDAATQEGQAFNSETLYTSGGSYQRACMEFDIRYPPGDSVVRLNFDIMSNNNPYTASLYIYSYYGNGLANASDYNFNNNHRYIRYITSNPGSGSQAYSFNISNEFVRLRDAGQDHMGIVIYTADQYSNRQIINPSITVEQEGD